VTLYFWEHAKSKLNNQRTLLQKRGYSFHSLSLMAKKDKTDQQKAETKASAAKFTINDLQFS